VNGYRGVVNEPVEFVKELPRSWQFGHIGGNLSPYQVSTNTSVGSDQRQRYLDKYMKHIFFLILTALAFFGCQSAEMPKNRSLDCYVRYLQTEAKIRAEATLREGAPDPKPVGAPDGIQYQGVDMKMLTMPSISYQFDQTGKLSPTHTFSWKDAKKQMRQFEMKMSPITQFGFGSKTISRQQPTTIRWDGKPLEKGETLVFLWENAALRKTVPMEVINISSEPAVEFPAAKIAELDPGEWTLYLVRKKLTKADLNGVAATGIMEYYTKTDTIQVE